MTALILVDIQNDFMPKGALGVEEGEQILPVVNELLSMPFDVIVASKDWHPEGHMSFAIWPDHCVQGTRGAEFHPGWDSSKVQAIFHKGTNPTEDSYSTFSKDTGLEDYLKKRGVHTVYIAGLTTEYCVRSSSLDALELGFKVNVVLDGCKGIDKNEARKAVEEMKKAGVRICLLEEIRGGGI